MIPENLLHLACREFPTCAHAVEASPDQSGSDILWHEVRSPQVEAINFDLPRNGWAEYQTRFLHLERLPSGFWAWLPTHPDDLATVAEHKLVSAKQFGATQVLVRECLGPPHPEDSTKYFADIERVAKAELGRELLSHLKEGLFYRTALIVRRGRVERNYGLYPCVTCALMYAEEIQVAGVTSEG